MAGENDATVKIVSNIDNTYYGKFLANEEKIRKLADANPNSYAAEVVRSVDHFLEARAFMEEYLSEFESQKSCCIHRLAVSILKEFSISTRASELFAIWTSEFRNIVKGIAKITMKSERNNKSDLDRDARVCSAILMTQGDKAKAIKFLDECRQKYPNEVFFHRIYCDLFLFTTDLDAGLKASEEVAKLFPNHPNILHARAGLLRVTTDTGDPDYPNWGRQKKQVELVKDAYKNYIRVAPKDQRQFAENNHVLAYLSLKYSTPSSQMSHSDLREINLHLQNALNAEKDILPCFLPFKSHAKDFVKEYIIMHPSVVVYKEGKTCTIDMTTHGIPGRPKPPFPTDNMTVVDMRKPTTRRIDICVQHRKLLKHLLSDPASAILAQTDDYEDMDCDLSPANNNNDADDFEDIVLYQMSLSKKSKLFTSKVIHLTVAEDSLYSIASGFFEMVVADMTEDVIKLQLDLGTKSPDNRTLKKLMKKFCFGTVWSLKNPDFHMENGDEKAMYIRTVPECLIPTNGSQDCPKCRNCFTKLTPGQHCSKCKRAAYCGKECQTQDWKYIKHKLICSEAFNKLYK